MVDPIKDAKEDLFTERKGDHAAGETSQEPTPPVAQCDRV